MTLELINPAGLSVPASYSEPRASGGRRSVPALGRLI